MSDLQEEQNIPSKEDLTDPQASQDNNQHINQGDQNNQDNNKANYNDIQNKQQEDQQNPEAIIETEDDNQNILIEKDNQNQDKVENQEVNEDQEELKELQQQFNQNAKQTPVQNIYTQDNSKKQNLQKQSSLQEKKQKHHKFNLFIIQMKKTYCDIYQQELPKIQTTFDIQQKYCKIISLSMNYLVLSLFEKRDIFNNNLKALLQFTHIQIQNEQQFIQIKSKRQKLSDLFTTTEGEMNPYLSFVFTQFDCSFQQSDQQQKQYIEELQKLEKCLIDQLDKQYKESNAQKNQIDQLRQKVQVYDKKCFKKLKNLNICFKQLQDSLKIDKPKKQKHDIYYKVISLEAQLNLQLNQYQTFTQQTIEFCESIKQKEKQAYIYLKSFLTDYAGKINLHSKDLCENLNKIEDYESNQFNILNLIKQEEIQKIKEFIDVESIDNNQLIHFLLEHRLERLYDCKIFIKQRYQVYRKSNKIKHLLYITTSGFLILFEEGKRKPIKQLQMDFVSMVEKNSQYLEFKEKTQGVIFKNNQSVQIKFGCLDDQQEVFAALQKYQYYGDD